VALRRAGAGVNGVLSALLRWCRSMFTDRAVGQGVAICARACLLRSAVRLIGEILRHAPTSESRDTVAISCGFGASSTKPNCVRRPVPVQMWQGVSPVPVQMWQRCAQSWCRCGSVAPSPGVQSACRRKLKAAGHSGCTPGVCDAKPDLGHATPSEKARTCCEKAQLSCIRVQ
jgi:hypothetical protein